MLKTKQMWLEQTTYFSTNECISLIIKIDIVLYLHKCKPLPIKIRHLAIYSTESAISMVKSKPKSDRWSSLDFCIYRAFWLYLPGYSRMFRFQFQQYSFNMKPSALPDIAFPDYETHQLINFKHDRTDFSHEMH